MSTHADLFRLAITHNGQAGWNGTVELAAGTKVQQSENPAHMQMTRGKSGASVETSAPRLTERGP